MELRGAKRHKNGFDYIMFLVIGGMIVRKGRLIVEEGANTAKIKNTQKIRLHSHTF